MATRARAALGSGSTRSDIPELAHWAIGLFTDWSNNRAELEEKWQGNRDAFRGEDDVSWVDPDTDDRSDDSDEGTTTTFRGKTDWHSRNTIRITKQKVMTAFALVIDAVLQGGRVPFMLKLSGELKVNAEDLPPPMAQHIDNELGDMTERIQQQLARCHADGALRRAVLSAAIYGRGWVKFRPKVFQTRRMVALPPRLVADQRTGQVARLPDQWELAKAEETAPAVAFVSLWDLYYDVEAEDIRHGAGIIHRQYVSAYDLRMLAATAPGWDAEAVERAITDSTRDAPSQGDASEELTPRLRDVVERRNTIRLLECWVNAPREYVEAFAKTSGDQGTSDEPLLGAEAQEIEQEGDDVPVQLVLAGEDIVKLVPLPEGEPWPFYSVPWEEDIDEAETYGIADNLRQTQAMLNSALRCFEDNKRQSSALVLGIRRRMINNPGWDGKIKPGMIIDVAEDAKTVADAISAFQVPDVGNTLLPLIEMGRVMADEESMTPKIQAGGRDSNQTAYEASIRVEKAGKYMGAVVTNFDKYLIAPMVQDFYEWNMLDPAITTGKGAYDVVPLGFTSFQDRVVRLQAVQQLLGLVLRDPELRGMVKLDDALREVCKSLDLDPDQWLKTAQQMQQEKQRPNPAQVAALEEQRAKAAKTKAEAAAVGEKVKIERARAVADIRKSAEPPPQPTPGGPPQKREPAR